MNLFDSNRPKIFHKLAFLPGQYPIPRLQIFPLNDDLIEISMMLPINGDQFTGKWYTKHIPKTELNITVNALIENPELFVETYFETETKTLSPAITTKPKIQPQKKSLTNSLLLLIDDEEE